MIDLKDRKPRDLFVDVDGDWWLVLERRQWLHVDKDGDARVAFAGPDSYSPHLATAEEIKAFCDRFMPVGAAPSHFDGWTFQPWSAGGILFAKKGNTESTVGALHTTGGWVAWMPGTTRSFAHGEETGQAGRDAVVAALRSKGAKL